MNLPDALLPITVQYGNIPYSLDGRGASGALWQATKGKFLFNIPEIARYLVEDGRSVTIEQSELATTDDVARFLRMTPLAALCFQQGILAMHAAAVASKSSAVLIAGDSGVGKSVLLTALLQRGFMMMSDDLSILRHDDVSGVEVCPLYPEIVLYADGLELLDLAGSSNAPADFNRRSLAIPDRFMPVPKKLKAIYWLQVTKGNSVELSSYSGVNKVKAVNSLLYNSHIADTLLSRVTYLQYLSHITANVPILKVLRPQTASLDELSDIVAQGL